MKKRFALFLLGLGSLVAVSVNAANLSQDQQADPVNQTQQTTQVVPCYPDSVCGPEYCAPNNCWTDTVCTPAPCNPVPCAPAPCAPVQTPTPAPATTPATGPGCC